MKMIMQILLILSLATMAFPEKVGTFPDLDGPETMEILGNNIYVVQRSTVHTYNLSSLKRLHSCFSEGHGPGELVWDGGLSNYLVPFGDQMLIAGFHKAIIFKPEGKIIREFKIKPLTNFLYPLEAGYLALKFQGNPGQEIQLKVLMYDTSLNIIKEIYSQKYSGGRNMINLTFDGVALAVEGEKLYVEESPSGFKISIFNLRGEKLKTISLPEKRVKFGKNHREDAIRRIKQNPLVKEMGWEQYSKIIKFPEEKYLPPIQDMTVNNGLIFVQTQTRKDSQIEFIILKESGEVVKKCYLPYVECGYRNLIMGRPIRLYKFFGDYYYYMTENMETEEWELHRIRWR